ncbi:AAA family ATPase [Paratractidigestivibacter sp.]|uniref:ATP-binding protein n=1 Tax=Paratractidigestivibacter sp. TaxID=2847316 RepID=UPI002AC8F89D|nr:AAA family ATPase [Paratractidigestivibacter sp.]
MELERIATNTYDFENVRRNRYVYVDKTGLMYPLVDGSIGNQFFLSRPRRFGKSLLISTIQKLFEGRRDLFEGLAIDSLPWDWEETYPVLRLDMSLCSGELLGEVEAAVTSTLQRESERLGVPLRDAENLSDRFAWLIEDLADTTPSGQIVLLIDEYDKPLTRWVGTPEVAPFQAFLKSFYSIVKLTESKQRFCLMTGVSKFSRVSIFSDLNNLTDLTMSPYATEILGYTHDEVRANFPGRLAALADSLHTDVDGAFEELVRMYDGYCFDERMVPVFNPVSLGSALRDLRLSSYWFETGTPGWLMSYAKKAPIDPDGLEVGGGGAWHLRAGRALHAGRPLSDGLPHRQGIRAGRPLADIPARLPQPGGRGRLLRVARGRLHGCCPGAYLGLGARVPPCPRRGRRGRLHGVAGELLRLDRL